MAAEKVLEKESRDDETWREAMATDPDEWSEELRLRLLWTIPDSTFQKMAMLRSLFPAIMEKQRIWREAMASDQGEWSDDLKTKLLELNPGSTIQEIAEEISKRSLWREEGWPPTDSDQWPEEVKAQISAGKASGGKVIIVLDQDGYWTTLPLSPKEASAPDTVIMSIPWNSDRGVLGIGDTLKLDLDATEGNRIIQELKTRERERTWAQAVLTDPKDWSEELEFQLLALNPGSTIEEIAEEITRRRLLRKLRTIAEANPGTWWDQLKDQLPDSTVTSEEIEEIRRRLQKGALAEGEKGGHR